MEWISVEGGLPEKAGSYLVFHDSCYISMAYFNYKQEWCEMWGRERLKINHWQPLPEPPK